MKKNNYYSLVQQENKATINIYGDITSWAWEELGEMSAVNLSKKLDEIGDVEQIDVYINSYGGEVAEGLAIYNALKRHKAKVRTYCDGFACSIASVIFMAGDERIMNEASLLMIHNAWTWAAGNAAELRKQADDLEKITQASVEAYKAHSSLSEDEIKTLMDEETWILPTEALEYGFATKVEKTESKNANQSVRQSLFNIIKAHQEADDENVDDEENVDDVDKDVDEPQEPTDDESNDDSQEPETDEDNSDDTDGTDDGTSDDDSDEEKDNNNEEDATQKMCSFFNAIFKM
jgi:ATP-dependent Clp protease protease subunit